MDEQQFQQLLDMFPVVRSRDYHLTKWQDAWGEADKQESETQGIDREDPFWNKLRLAAERKVGAANADRFCKAFQRVHAKLVYEELSSDAARRFINSATN
ncbi:uncharacterized protein LOC131251004 isoform X2 [Magnolia sinica]|uniref:uncharacterized protein LOC131251004 isoform X2 n=1 Tax=Magnolia sinica TaxID=86752 RepID=UPI00265A0D4F|nr:uncharacterized protein LOC131251004 isoform X2 [Magnolia sinica]